MIHPIPLQSCAHPPTCNQPQLTLHLPICLLFTYLIKTYYSIKLQLYLLPRERNRAGSTLSIKSHHNVAASPLRWWTSAADELRKQELVVINLPYACQPGFGNNTQITCKNCTVRTLAQRIKTFVRLQNYCYVMIAVSCKIQSNQGSNFQTNFAAGTSWLF